ncbi:MAG: LysR family transcriptional regulator [Acidimicrobiales bacterium]
MAYDPLHLQLTTQHLDYLVAVDDHQTWALAAASCGVSPSALSQGLSELERRLGLALFDRVGRKRVLTANAAEVLAYARRVVAQTHDLERWADASKSGETGALRVGMIDVAAVAHFPDQLHAFRNRFPDVDLRLSVSGSTSLVDQLRSGNLDVAIVVEPIVPLPDLTMTPLLSEPLAVYAPEGQSGRKPGDWGPWVTFPSSSHSRQWIRQELAALGASFEVVAESHQPEVLREMVRLGIGWTVLPVSQAEAGPGAITRARQRPLFKRRLVIARRSGALPHPGVDQLISLIATT